MLTTRCSLLTHLCSIALLLWGQAAVAQHEVDHSWHDATELCQIFSSADHAKAALTAPSTAVADAGVGQKTLNVSLSVAGYRVLKQSARGPPEATAI